MILISIIIAVYNNEKYINNAINSVLAAGNDVEVVIIDDGSTDSTPIIVDAIAENNKNVSVIHQKNQWIYASFNNGIKAAKGEYIYILNSDDILVAGAIDSMRKTIEKYSYPDVVWTKVEMSTCDNDQRIISTKPLNPLVEKTEYVNTFSNESIYYLLKSGLLYNQANLYKRALFTNELFDNDVFGADYLLNIKMLRHINNYVILADDIYRFYIYEEGKGNTSIGKYYGYEHELYNRFYDEAIKTIDYLKITQKEVVDYIKKERRIRFSDELRRLLFNENSKSLEERFSIMFEESIDKTIYNVFSDELEEMECRFLSVLLEFINRTGVESIRRTKYCFAYELLDSILRYEKDEYDYEKIRKAVANKNNPFRIGEVIYSKLI